MNQGIGQRSTYMKPDNEIPTPLIFAFTADLSGMDREIKVRNTDPLYLHRDHYERISEML